ncbi:LINE-1 reverse transcriptase like, partial [Trifolium medium]|nr:LINE-1 reverse transcriptase like [Trifolium medium]
VKECWEEEGDKRWMGLMFKDELKALKVALKTWNKVVYGEAESKISSLTEKIKELEIRGESYELTEEEKRCRVDCCEALWLLLKSEESIHFQRARSRWLKEGDANTRFFHACVKGRQRMNAIVALKKGEGWIENPSSIKEEIVSYFANHFAEEEWNRPTLDGINFPTLSLDEAGRLDDGFQEEEIRRVVFDSDGNKSPGPDGFNGEFFKASWEVVKGDLKTLFEEFHTYAKLPKCLLAYFVTLIPKVSNPHSINEFRPISLLVSVYKMLAKVLATRLG